MAQDFIGRVQRLLSAPAKEWEDIAAEPVDVQALYRNYIGPLVIFASVASFIGTYFFTRGLVHPLFGPVLGHAILSFILGLALVYVFALIIDALAPSFGAEKNFAQAFKVAAYSPTPSWVGAVFLLVPGLKILSVLATLYSLYLLFLGLPKLMKPAPDKGMTYTIIAILSIVGLSILAGAITSTGPFY